MLHISAPRLTLKEAKMKHHAYLVESKALLTLTRRMRSHGRTIAYCAGVTISLAGCGGSGNGWFGTNPSTSQSPVAGPDPTDEPPRRGDVLEA